jgi:hypothetical protein
MSEETEPAGDDLDATLAQFVRETAGEKAPAQPIATRDPSAEPTAKPEAESDPKPAPSAADKPPLFGEYKSKYAPPAPLDPRDAQIAELLDSREVMRHWAGVIDQERAQAQEKADAEKVYVTARAIVADSGKAVPPEYEKTWLLAEYQLNDELRTAWDQRYTSEDAARHCSRVIGKTMQKLGNTLSKMIEPELTADRDAVSAAVRGASHAPAPPLKPLNVSKISSNKEFADHVEKTHGYRPRLGGV